MAITASCTNCGKDTAHWFALCGRCTDKINRNKDKDWQKGYDAGYKNGCEDTEHAIIQLIRKADVRVLHKKRVEGKL
jgi:hypothetical protein